MSRHTSGSAFHKSKTLNDKYMLGDEIGKGAYGRVYKGLDLENGDFVAIKQVSLENIPPEDLASIMVSTWTIKISLGSRVSARIILGHQYTPALLCNPCGYKQFSQ